MSATENKTDFGSPNRRPKGGERCLAAQADMKAYLDRELHPFRALMLRLHLLSCASCREEASWLQRLGEDMRDLERALPAAGLRSRIMASLPEATPRAAFPIPFFSSSPFTPGRIAFASCLLLGLLTGAFALGRYSAFTAVPVAQTQIVRTPPRTVPMMTGGLAVNTHEDRPQPAPQPRLPISATNNDKRQAVSGHPEDYSDPISRKAVELMQQEARESAQQAPTIEPSAPESPKTLASGQSEPFRLQLKVNDLASTRQRLQSWVGMTGGQTFVQPQTVAKNSKSTIASADGTLLAMRIPSDRAGALLTVMRQMGSVSTEQPSANTGGRRAVRMSNAVKQRLNPGDEKNEHSPAEGSYVLPSVPITSFSFPKFPAPGSAIGSRPWVTLLVRLQPEHHQSTEQREK